MRLPVITECNGTALILSKWRKWRTRWGILQNNAGKHEIGTTLKLSEHFGVCCQCRN